MLKTNADRLVEVSVQGKVAPQVRSQAMAIDREGVPFILPGVGGITYNIKVGDPAFGWEGDHVEPCVSTAADTKDRRSGENRAYNILTCVGNKATVISGEAKGAQGVVTGMHGGIEHVLIDFPDDALDKMAIEDKILIRAVGQGLRLLDFPSVKVFNLDPRLLDKMSITVRDDKLIVPVAKTVPSHLMGSGIGSSDVASGDYDITTTDESELKEHGLMDLRFGDLVAIIDADNSYGRSFRRGAVSIGVVVHSDCRLAGHGPGVTTLFTTNDGSILPQVDPGANIGRYLGIGRYRRE